MTNNANTQNTEVPEITDARFSLYKNIKLLAWFKYKQEIYNVEDALNFPRGTIYGWCMYKATEDKLKAVAEYFNVTKEQLYTPLY